MTTEPLEVKSLLQQHASIISKLRKLGVVRSNNMPIADYAEYLVTERLGLKLSASSNKSVDAIDPRTGLTYQIKARRITSTSGRRQLGVMRSLDFDYLVAILFDESFDVAEAYMIPSKLIAHHAKFSKHQNGHILQLRGDILSSEGVKDITTNLS